MVRGASVALLLAIGLVAVPSAVQAQAAPDAADGYTCIVLLGPTIDPPACRAVAHDTVTYVGGPPAAHGAVDLVFDNLEPVWHIARVAFCIYETGDIIHCQYQPA